MDRWIARSEKHIDRRVIAKVEPLQMDVPQAGRVPGAGPTDAPVTVNRWYVCSPIRPALASRTNRATISAPSAGSAASV